MSRYATRGQTAINTRLGDIFQAFWKQCEDEITHDIRSESMYLHHSTKQYRFFYNNVKKWVIVQFRWPAEGHVLDIHMSCGGLLGCGEHANDADRTCVWTPVPAELSFIVSTISKQLDCPADRAVYHICAPQSAVIACDGGRGYQNYVHFDACGIKA
jgi:hypothetical protein